MRTIKVSEEVWNEIAKRGKFGETEDDVLRRVFGLEKSDTTVFRKTRIATDPLSTYIEDNRFIVQFASGAQKEFELPEKWNKEAIRIVTHNAIQFAKEHNATDGQVNAVRKKLTDSGYHISR